MMSKYQNLKKIEQMLSDHDGARKDWAILVGRLVLAFGDIENLTMLAISRISADSILDTARSLLLGKRIELIQEILVDKSAISESARSDFIKELTTLKGLLDKRNLIVHNPLVLQMYQDDRTGEWVAQGAIASLRNEEKKISVEELSALVERVEACRTRLFDVYGRVSMDLIQRRRRKPK